MHAKRLKAQLAASRAKAARHDPEGFLSKPSVPELGNGWDEAMAATDELPSPEFGGGLCGCLRGTGQHRSHATVSRERARACRACGMPCIVYGRNMERAGIGSAVLCGLAYAASCCCLLTLCAVPAVFRGSVERETGYPPAPCCAHAAAHACCCPCALAQEERALDDLERTERAVRARYLADALAEEHA